MADLIEQDDILIIDVDGDIVTVYFTDDTSIDNQFSDEERKLMAKAEREYWYIH